MMDYGIGLASSQVNSNPSGDNVDKDNRSNLVAATFALMKTPISGLSSYFRTHPMNRYRKILRSQICEPPYFGLDWQVGGFLGGKLLVHGKSRKISTRTLHTLFTVAKLTNMEGTTHQYGSQRYNI